MFLKNNTNSLWVFDRVWKNNDLGDTQDQTERRGNGEEAFHKLNLPIQGLMTGNVKSNVKVKVCLEFCARC